MKQTRKEQIARFLATDVMGWHPYFGIGETQWRDENNSFVVWFGDWRPYENLNQAFQVLFKNGFFRVGLGIVELTKDSGRLFYVDYSDDAPESLAEAICTAVCRARGMEI